MGMLTMQCRSIVFLMYKIVYICKYFHYDTVIWYSVRVLDEIFHLQNVLAMMFVRYSFDTRVSVVIV